MRKLVQALSLAFAAVLLMSGCTITKKVTPVASGSVISTIYLQVNPEVHMDGLHPEIELQLKEMGFRVESFKGERPKEARYVLSYTANWAWDMAMYLTYFESTLKEGDKVIGRAEYDARKGGGNMSKFGKTEDKIRPLLLELFENVKRQGAAPVQTSK